MIVIKDEFNLKPCPLCGNEIHVHGPEDWRPTLYDPDSGGDPVVLQCDCGLTFSINSYDYQETYDAWNKRTPELGNESVDLWNAMFPKCNGCKSKPSDTSNILCMCSNGMCLPRQPQGDHFTFQFGDYYGDYYYEGDI